jgi:hypothetical protein
VDTDEASAEDTPECSARAAQHLEAIISGAHLELFDEWSEAAADAGLRVREEMLVVLLDLLVVLKREYGALAIEKQLRVLGNRGLWLAAKNPRHASLSVRHGSLEEAFSTGSRQQRIFALTELRRSDADRARELLSRGFAEESAENRTALVECLATQLTLADEPFLEAVLDDRRMSVRTAAAELLYRLPESRLMARMQDRARRFVQFERSHVVVGQSARRVTVTLPEARDDSMARDGIDAKRPAHLGDRARLLSQIVGATPLMTWLEFDDANGIVEAFASSEFSEALLLGVALAAGRQQADVFAEAVLARILGLGSEHIGVYLDWLPALTKALSGRQIYAFLEQQLACRLQSPALPPLISAVERRLDAATSRLILDMLRERARSSLPPLDFGMSQALEGSLALRLDPSLHEEARQGWPTDRDTWTTRQSNTLELFVSTLAFRHEMLEALRGPR